MFAVAAMTLLCLWLVLTFVEMNPAWAEQLERARQLLQVASLMAALGIGALAISRWYLTSDAPSLWIGVAFLLFAAARLGFVELVPSVVPDATAVTIASWLRPATQVVVALLLIRAVRTLPVTTDISGPRLVLVATGATIALTVLLQFVPPVATVIDGAQNMPPRVYGPVNQLGVMPLVWAVLGIAFALRGHQRRRWLFSWLGLTLFAVALGDLTRVFAPPPLEGGLFGKEVLRLAGLLAGVNGAFREILYTYRDSSTRLAKSEYTALTAQERIREGQAAAEERAHEARSALAAIEGATRTLEHYRDRLPAETQAALSTAVSGEIRRLQRLVSVESSDGDIAPFSVAESLAPLVATERARGTVIDVDVAGDLDVIGRAGATEQAMQTIFDNARRYAAGTTLTVRGYREGSWVILRIEDRGPGVAPEQREAIFRRGVRGDAALDVAGSGLGLYVAAKLMQEQAGEMWVDERAGGGASFALALPAASVSQEAVKGSEDGRQVSEDGGFSSARRGD